MHASAKQRDLDPISPELALVDPVLRQQLRPSRVVQRPRRPVVTADALKPIPAAEAPPISAAPTRRPRSRSKLRTVLYVVVAVVAVSMFALFWRERGANRNAGPAPVLVPKAGLAKSIESIRHANVKVSTHRPLRWKPVPYAAFYNVVLLRGRSRVDIWPRKTQLSLATLSRRVRPGTYRWFVYPGFGQRHPRTSAHTFYGGLAAQGELTIPRSR